MTVNLFIKVHEHHFKNNNIGLNTIEINLVPYTFDDFDYLSNRYCTILILSAALLVFSCGLVCGVGWTIII